MARGAFGSTGRDVLALFTRVPGAEPAKTRLAAALGAARAEALARAFLLDTLSRLAALDVALALWHTPPHASERLRRLLRQHGAEGPATRADAGETPRLVSNSCTRERGHDRGPALFPQSGGALGRRLEAALQFH